MPISQGKSQHRPALSIETTPRNRDLRDDGQAQRRRPGRRGGPRRPAEGGQGPRRRWRRPRREQQRVLVLVLVQAQAQAQQQGKVLVRRGRPGGGGAEEWGRGDGGHQERVVVVVIVVATVGGGGLGGGDSIGPGRPEFSGGVPTTRFQVRFSHLLPSDARILSAHNGDSLNCWKGWHDC